jgi:hypothetical protein
MFRRDKTSGTPRTNASNRLESMTSPNETPTVVTRQMSHVTGRHKARCHATSGSRAIVRVLADMVRAIDIAV